MNTIRVTARDDSDQPIPGASVVLTSTAPVSLTQPPPTNSYGWADGFVASTQVGTAEIHALIDGVPISETATVTFQGADLAVTKSGPAQAVTGQSILYNLSVENQGATPAEGVVVTDTLPASVEYLAHSAPVTPTINGSHVTWELGSLGGGESLGFALMGRVTETIAPGETVQNVVQVSSLTPDEDTQNNVFTTTAQAIVPYSHTLILDPATVTARLGATQTLRLRIANTGPLANVYTVSVTGLDPAWYTPITDSFPLNPGGLATADLKLHVADCLVTGTLPFTVAAHAQQAGSLAAAGATLNLQADPQQMDLTPAAGSKTGSRSVLFSWRTDAPTTGQLTLYPSASPTQAITRTTPLSRVHTLLVEDLSRNTQYTWWVDSASRCGQTTSPQRTFSVGNGIVFAEHNPPPFDIHRDYGQLIPITLRNEDSLVTHTLRLSVEHPYADLIAGFVGPGSVDDGAEYISLAPDATQVITLAIHAQDAEQVNYDLTAQVIADEDSPGNEIVDYAHLSVRVLRANNYTMTLVSEDPDTLVKTYQVKNLGLPITDLSVQALDPATGLPARALIQPALNHARLGKAGDPDDTLTFQVIPLFSPDDAIALQALSRMGAGGGLASPLPQRTDFDIKVVATVLDTVQELVGNYACLGDNQLYAVTLHNVWASYFNHDWYCTNRPSIDLDFPVPGNINVSDILSATVSTSLSPRSAGVRPHDVQILFNGNQVGELLDQVPDGSYTFSVDPAFFNPSANPVQPVNQTLGLRTYHFNGGHYVVNTSSRLDLPLANYTRYVCAADDQEARDKAGQGFWPIPTHIDIQIVQPQAGAQLELGWPVVLEATVDDGHESYIYYPVLARIVYSDQPQDVKTVMLVPYSSNGTIDTYRGYWLPARAGEVSITQTVYAGIVSGSDNVEVTVEPEATFSISGQATWTASGNPIGGVTVEARQGSNVIGSDTTDSADGTFQVSDLPAGTYQLTASREGYTFVSAADPSQSTIQAQVDSLNGDAENQNFVAVLPPPPQLPDTGFKGANWLRFLDDEKGGVNYQDSGVGWNLELAEHLQYTDFPFDALRALRGPEGDPEAQHVYTIVRLNAAWSAVQDPNSQTLKPCTHLDIMRWMADTDEQYLKVLAQMKDAAEYIPIFILNNEPNHHKDEGITLTAEEYAHLYNCYYQTRWTKDVPKLIKKDDGTVVPSDDETIPKRPFFLFISGPAQEGRGYQTFLSELLAPGVLEQADGFAMHVYGYYQESGCTNPSPDNNYCGDATGENLFNDWLDRILNEINNNPDMKDKPIIITEYNPGVNAPQDANPPPYGWRDWFDQTYCWVQTKNPTVAENNELRQIRGLLYFADEEDEERGRNVGENDNTDNDWWESSLNKHDVPNTDDDRRGYWLQAPSSTAPCQPQGQKSPGPLGYRILPASFTYKEPGAGNGNLQIPGQSFQSQGLPASVPIGGVISGTLGLRGYNTIFFVNDDLEIPAGKTLTITLGTTLVFSPGLSMNIAGQLIAEGNNVFPIRFISTDEAGWAGLRFQPSAQGSRCLGCSLENLITDTVAVQVEAPVTFQYGFIRDVPGGTAISSTVPFTLSNVVIDYVGTGLHVSGTPTTTHMASHVTLTRCQQGIINRGQTFSIDNSILNTCGIAVSTELSGTTVISYSLLSSNGQDFITEVGSQLVQGSGILTAAPGFEDFPNDFHLRADSLAVNAANPQADYSRELGYNGRRADLGAYGNTMEATQKPPLDQMGVMIETDAPVRIVQPGQTITYGLTLKNSGTVTETFGISVEGNDAYFQASLFENGAQSPQYFYLAPQAQIPITVWLHINPQVNTTTISRTFLIRAYSYVQDSIELTALLTAFQENNGQVVMEAEHFTGQTSRSSRVWITQTTLSGYMGSSYLGALPDTGVQFTNSYTNTSPQLSYMVNFTTTGIYTVWVRGYAPDGGGDSLYIGLDQQAPITTTTVTGFVPRAWSWTAKRGNQDQLATIEVTEPGFHILHLWMREDGLRLDRILFTTDNEYNPVGNGPPESDIR